MTFRARYKSECASCDDGIVPGQEVEQATDGLYQHVICPEDQDFQGKPRPVCPRCFMVLLPDGSCGTCEPEY